MHAMLYEVAHFMVNRIQNVIWAYVLCYFNPTKDKFHISFLKAFIIIWISTDTSLYIIGQNFSVRKIAFVVMCISFSYFVLDGALKERILRVLVYALTIFFVDIFSLLMAFPILEYGTFKNITPEIALLGMDVYTLVFYNVALLGDMIFIRKKRHGVIDVMQLLLGISQTVVLVIMTRYHVDFIASHAIEISILSVCLLVLEYLVVNEFFRQIIKQQKRETQLEQEMLKRQYQYDYYLLAQKEGEEIRDLRHDMKNHLQAMSYLVQLDGKEEQQRAMEMLERLKQKLND